MLDICCIRKFLLAMANGLDRKGKGVLALHMNESIFSILCSYLVSLCTIFD